MDEELKGFLERSNARRREKVKATVEDLERELLDVFCPRVDRLLREQDAKHNIPQLVNAHLINLAKEVSAKARVSLYTQQKLEHLIDTCFEQWQDCIWGVTKGQEHASMTQQTQMALHVWDRFSLCTRWMERVMYDYNRGMRCGGDRKIVDFALSNLLMGMSSSFETLLHNRFVEEFKKGFLRRGDNLLTIAKLFGLICLIYAHRNTTGMKSRSLLEALDESRLEAMTMQTSKTWQSISKMLQKEYTECAEDLRRATTTREYFIRVRT